MKRFELASVYFDQYENTDVFISDISEFDNGIVFDLSDGSHWFSDDSVTCQVSESLVGVEIGWDDVNGYFIINDDGSASQIGWC